MQEMVWEQHGSGGKSFVWEIEGPEFKHQSWKMQKQKHTQKKQISK